MFYYFHPLFPIHIFLFFSRLECLQHVETRNISFNPISTRKNRRASFRAHAFRKKTRYEILLKFLKTVFSCYPIALKGYRGIVFTHGVWMGGWAAGKSLSGL